MKMIRFFDFAMGTELISLKLNEDPVTINITNPEAVIDIHKSAIKAGADFLTTNTFGAYRHKFNNSDDLLKAAFDNINKAGAKNIAFDMGTIGRLLEPYGDLEKEECLDIFMHFAQTGASLGADIILIETMSDIEEMRLACTAAKSTGLPVYATMTFNETGRTFTGAAIKDMVDLLHGFDVQAVGLNCGFGPSSFMPLVKELRSLTVLPIIVQPNAGMPVFINGEAVYELEPKDFAAQMLEILNLGADIFGGCCGTTAEHLKEMVHCLSLA